MQGLRQADRGNSVRTAPIVIDLVDSDSSGSLQPTQVIGTAGEYQPKGEEQLDMQAAVGTRSRCC